MDVSTDGFATVAAGGEVATDYTGPTTWSLGALKGQTVQIRLRLVDPAYLGSNAGGMSAKHVLVSTDLGSPCAKTADCDDGEVCTTDS